MKKLIMITGAKSGFGKETFLSLYNNRENVFLLIDLKWESKNHYELDLKRIVYKDVDVTNRKSFSSAITEAEKYFNTYIEVAINNAGIMPLSLLKDQDWNEIEQIVDINIKGVINGSKLVLNNMIKNKKGTIVNISSLAGLRTFTTASIYCATKFAVIGFSDTLRREVASSNIRVSTICPGAAETNLLSTTSKTDVREEYEDWKKSIGGVMSAKDVSNAICYVVNAPQEVNVRQIQLATTNQDA